MIRHSLLLVFFLVFNISFAQKYVDATIIKSNNDTINSKIMVSGALFNSKNIDIRSFYNNVFLVDNNLEFTNKIKTKDIKELTIKDDGFGNSFKFINKKGLLEQVLYDGKKIKWIRSFTTNLYDGSLSSTDYIVNEKNEIVKLGGLGSKRKAKLKEVTMTKPVLASEIDKLETYDVEAVKKLLQKFEE